MPPKNVRNKKKNGLKKLLFCVTRHVVPLKFQLLPRHFCRSKSEESEHQILLNSIVITCVTPLQKWGSVVRLFTRMCSVADAASFVKSIYGQYFKAMLNRNSVKRPHNALLLSWNICVFVFGLCVFVNRYLGLSNWSWRLTKFQFGMA